MRESLPTFYINSLQNMRFNEDLSLRPPWLPPSGAPPRLALADWWDRHSPSALAAAAAAQPLPARAGEAKAAETGAAGAAVAAAPGPTSDTSSSSSSRSWWQVSGAAESAAAAPLREAQRASLQARQLLPQLIAAAVSGQATAATSGGDAVLGAARQLAALHGVTASSLADAVREAVQPGSSSGAEAGAAKGAAQLASNGGGSPDADSPASAGACASSPRLCRLLGLLGVAIFTADDAARRLHGEAPSDGERAESPKEASARRAEAARQLPGCLAALQVLWNEVALCASPIQHQAVSFDMLVHVATRQHQTASWTKFPKPQLVLIRRHCAQHARRWGSDWALQLESWPTAARWRRPPASSPRRPPGCASCCRSVVNTMFVKIGSHGVWFPSPWTACTNIRASMEGPGIHRFRANTSQLLRRAGPAAARQPARKRPRSQPRRRRRRQRRLRLTAPPTAQHHQTPTPPQTWVPSWSSIGTQFFFFFFCI